jgi:two-component system response regulator FixJ
MTGPVVHIVDDDAAVRRSLERLLATAGFATRCYDCGRAILEATPPPAGGCLLIDVRLPDIDGVELQARLRASGISLPSIIITGHGDVPTAVRAMKRGAFDFIEKPFSGESLLRSIEAALTARRDHGASEARWAADRLRSLTRRERQVLDRLVLGRPNKVIACDLGLSVRTVEVHRARMMERLGVRQLAEAVRMAVLAQMAQDTAPPDG